MLYFVSDISIARLCAHFINNLKSMKNIVSTENCAGTMIDTKSTLISTIHNSYSLFFLTHEKEVLS